VIVSETIYSSLRIFSWGFYKSPPASLPCIRGCFLLLTAFATSPEASNYVLADHTPLSSTSPLFFPGLPPCTVKSIACFLKFGIIRLFHTNGYFFSFPPGTSLFVSSSRLSNKPVLDQSIFFLPGRDPLPRDLSLSLLSIRRLRDPRHAAKAVCSPEVSGPSLPPFSMRRYFNPARRELHLSILFSRSSSLSPRVGRRRGMIVVLKPREAPCSGPPFRLIFAPFLTPNFLVVPFRVTGRVYRFFSANQVPPFTILPGPPLLTSTLLA